MYKKLCIYISMYGSRWVNLSLIWSNSRFILLDAMTLIKKFKSYQSQNKIQVCNRSGTVLEMAPKCLSPNSSNVMLGTECSPKNKWRPVEMTSWPALIAASVSRAVQGSNQRCSICFKEKPNYLCPKLVNSTEPPTWSRTATTTTWGHGQCQVEVLDFVRCNRVMLHEIITCSCYSNEWRSIKKYFLGPSSSSAVNLAKAPTMMWKELAATATQASSMKELRLQLSIVPLSPRKPYIHREKFS